MLETSMAVLRLFDRLGDREKLHRNRMRYLVHDMGFERFRELVLKERSIVRATKPVSAKLEPIEEPLPNEELQASDQPVVVGEEEYSRWAFTNVVPQKQKGFFAVNITLPAGDISAEQLRRVADICRKYSKEGNVRNTPNQSMVLRWVPGGEVPSVYQELRATGLARPGAYTIASVVGCTGTTSCNLAITNSHRLAKEFQSRLLELGLEKDEDLKGVTIKISGCCNSCGHHAIATFGFYGSAIRVEETLTPACTMLIGGRIGPKARLGKYLMKVPAKRAIDAVLKVIGLYRAERRGGESLYDWLDRISLGEGASMIKNMNDLKKALEEVARLPPPSQEPSAYIDWGSDERYRAKTARGECAA